MVLNKKETFDDWFYNLSYKSSVAVSLFAFGLCFCILYPFMLVFLAVFFICQYYVDKYNLMYVYPLEFES